MSQIWTSGVRTSERGDRRTVRFNNETDVCSVCGATPRIERITYTQVIGDKVYIVRDVPAQVCPRCGEQYLLPSTVDAIQNALERGEPTKTVQVPGDELAPTTSHSTR